MLDVGSAMEKFDMGDAFVGAWDIANLVSDFLMERMGAETSGCSTKAPTSLSSSRYGAVVGLKLNRGGRIRVSWCVRWLESTPLPRKT